MGGGAVVSFRFAISLPWCVSYVRYTAYLDVVGSNLGVSSICGLYSPVTKTLQPIIVSFHQRLPDLSSLSGGIRTALSRNSLWNVIIYHQIFSPNEETIEISSLHRLTDIYTSIILTDTLELKTE